MTASRWLLVPVALLAATPMVGAELTAPGPDVDALAADALALLPVIPLDVFGILTVLDAMTEALQPAATDGAADGGYRAPVAGGSSATPVFSDPPLQQAPVATVPERPVSEVTVVAPASNSALDSAWVRPAATVAVAAGAGIAFLAAFNPRLLRWLVPLPLLTYTREALLENPMRARLLQAVEANPGVHFNQLVKDLELGRGQAEHHLRALEKARLVSRHIAGGYACYFADPQAARDLKDVVNVLKAEPARRVLQHILENPGTRPADVARAQGMSPDSALYHLRQLSQAQLLSVVVAGDRRLLFPTPAAQRALAALRVPVVLEAPLVAA